MEESSLLDKINPNMSYYIVENTKVNDFSTKHWDLSPLVNILPDHIINKIKSILIPVLI